MCDIDEVWAAQLTAYRMYALDTDYWARREVTKTQQASGVS